MADISATYVSPTSFTTSGDMTDILTAGRKVRANCGADGYKTGAVVSASYSSGTGLSTVTLEGEALTANLMGFLYGVSDVEALPVHGHADLAVAIAELQLPPRVVVRLNSGLTNVTGDNTAYKLAFDQVINDPESLWNNTNKLFTAPTNGLYHLSSVLALEGIASNHTLMWVYFQQNEAINQTLFYGNPYYLATGGYLRMAFSMCQFLDAGDTVSFGFRVSNGSKVVDVTAGYTKMEIFRVS